ncbi:MAG: helix-turn-helix domain-containing protein [Azospirillum sp.]|nr:helix-turn-helix domain-containing protein [Azospirillum sp.]
MERNEAEIITQKVVALLKKERNNRHITKLYVSQETGLSRTAITLIENNQNSPTLRTLLMIANCIGVDLKEIIAQAEQL